MAHIRGPAIVLLTINSELIIKWNLDPSVREALMSPREKVHPGQVLPPYQLLPPSMCEHYCGSGLWGTGAGEITGT